MSECEKGKVHRSSFNQGIFIHLLSFSFRYSMVLHRPRVWRWMAEWLQARERSRSATDWCEVHWNLRKRQEERERTVQVGKVRIRFRLIIFNESACLQINGEVYDGEWKNGVKHGSGMWKGPKGNKHTIARSLADACILLFLQATPTSESGRVGRQMVSEFTLGSMVLASPSSMDSECSCACVASRRPLRRWVLGLSEARTGHREVRKRWRVRGSIRVWEARWFR